MRPWRTVLADPAPRIREGRGGVLGPDTDRRARWWEMRAECGHLVERSVRYTPSGEGRGYVRHRARTDILPAPARVRCEHCPREPIAAAVQSATCPCIYPDIGPETVSEEAPDGVCACGHTADEHAEDGQCQAAEV